MSEHGKTGLISRAFNRVFLDRSVSDSILLDPGSQKSFVTVRLTTALGLQPVRSEAIRIFGITGKATSDEHLQVFNLKLKSRFSNRKITISCLGVPSVIGRDIPRAEFHGDIQPLADIHIDGFPNEVDLVIGADYLHLVYDDMYRRVGKLTASPTIFG